MPCFQQQSNMSYCACLCRYVVRTNCQGEGRYLACVKQSTIVKDITEHFVLRVGYHPVSYDSSSSRGIGTPCLLDSHSRWFSSVAMHGLLRLPLQVELFWIDISPFHLIPTSRDCWHWRRNLGKITPGAAYQGLERPSQTTRGKHVRKWWVTHQGLLDQVEKSCHLNLVKSVKE